MYKAGRDEEARRAIHDSIIRENTPEGEPQTYQPTTEEINKAEIQYYASRRAFKYGPMERQIEFMTENGITAWKAHVADIKSNIPKP